MRSTVSPARWERSPPTQSAAHIFVESWSVSVRHPIRSAAPKSDHDSSGPQERLTPLFIWFAETGPTYLNRHSHVPLSGPNGKATNDRCPATTRSSFPIPARLIHKPHSVPLRVMA